MIRLYRACNAAVGVEKICTGDIVIATLQMTTAMMPEKEEKEARFSFPLETIQQTFSLRISYI